MTALDGKAPLAINELLSNSFLSISPSYTRLQGMVSGVSGICSTTRVLNKIQEWTWYLAGYTKSLHTKNGLAFDARFFFFANSLFMLLLDMSVFVPVESRLLLSRIIYCSM